MASNVHEEIRAAAERAFRRALADGDIDRLGWVTDAFHRDAEGKSWPADAMAAYANHIDELQGLDDVPVLGSGDSEH
jgi:hypothetical protein